jgi:regulator of RNase E activity RraA
MPKMPELEALMTRLRSCDTPTVCNAIEVAQGKRGFDRFTHRMMQWSGPADARIVGFARTAKIVGRMPPSEPADVIRARRMAYFRAMAEGPRPAIAVVEDEDGEAAMGAWWGEVHAQVHGKVFGLAGAVTNGVMRDLGDMPDDFPVLAGSIGPSHGFVHVRDIGTPVTVFGMSVADGDLIHADRHGAVAIPPEALPKLSDALDVLFSSEEIVLGPIRDGTVTLAEFEALWAAFEKARI